MQSPRAPTADTCLRRPRLPWGDLAHAGWAAADLRLWGQGTAAVGLPGMLPPGREGAGLAEEGRPLAGQAPGCAPTPLHCRAVRAGLDAAGLHCRHQGRPAVQPVNETVKSPTTSPCRVTARRPPERERLLAPRPAHSTLTLGVENALEPPRTRSRGSAAPGADMAAGAAAGPGPQPHLPAAHLAESPSVTELLLCPCPRLGHHPLTSHTCLPTRTQA